MSNNKNKANKPESTETLKEDNVSEAVADAPVAKAKRGRKPKDPNAPPKVKREDVFGVQLETPDGKKFMRVQTKHLRSGVYISRFLLSDSKGRDSAREPGATKAHGTNFQEAKERAQSMVANAQAKGWIISKGAASKPDTRDDIPEASSF